MLTKSWNLNFLLLLWLLVNVIFVFFTNYCDRFYSMLKKFKNGWRLVQNTFYAGLLQEN